VGITVHASSGRFIFKFRRAHIGSKYIQLIKFIGNLAIFNQQNAQHRSLHIYIVISNWIFLHGSIHTWSNKPKKYCKKPNYPLSYKFDM